MTTRPSRGPCIVLAAENGFESRYFFRSSLFDELQKRGARIVALVPNASEPYIRSSLESRGAAVEQLEVHGANAAMQTRVQRLAQTLRQRGLPNVGDLAFLNDKTREYRLGFAHPAAEHAATVGTWLLQRSRLMRRALVSVESALVSVPFYDDLFDRYAPAVVVTPEPGYQPYQLALLRKARRRGVRTATVITGWDKGVARGMAGFIPDQIHAWGPAMRAELVDHQGFAPRRVHDGGAALFDGYISGGSLLDRAAICRRLGLDPAKKLVIFAGKSPASYPNYQIAAMLAQALRRGELGPDVQLVFRLHPIYFKTSRRELFEQRIRTYREIARDLGRDGDIVCSVPHVASDLLRLDTTPEDALEVASLIRHCDVMVTLFSTVALEACICDRPVVNVAFDVPGHTVAEDGVPYRSIGIDMNQSHNLRFRRSGAAATVTAEPALYEAIRRYLADPSLHASERRQFAVQEAGPCDGEAGARIAAAVMDTGGDGVSSTQVMPSARQSGIAQWLRLSVVTVFRYGIGAMIGFVNAAVLGPSALGALKVVQTVAGYGARTDLGITKIFQRDVVVLSGRGDEPAIRELTGVVFLESLATTVLYVAVLWAAWALGFTFSGYFTPLILALASGMILADRIGIFLDALVVSRGLFDVTARRELYMAILAPALMIPLLLLYRLPGVFVAQLCVSLFAVTYTWSRVRPAWTLSRQPGRTWALLRRGIPVFLSLIGMKMVATLEILILPFYVSALDVGLFGFAIGMATMAQLVPREIHNIAFHRLGQARGEGATDDTIRRFFILPLAAYAACATVCVLLVTDAYRLLVLLALPDFTASTRLLPLIGLGAAVSACSGFAGQALFVLDRIPGQAKLHLAISALKAPLVLAAVSVFALQGAAMTYALGYLALFVGTIYLGFDSAAVTARVAGRPLVAMLVSLAGAEAMRLLLITGTPDARNLQMLLHGPAPRLLAAALLAVAWTVAVFALMFRRERLFEFGRATILDLWSRTRGRGTVYATS